jgi:hypothetical protein
MMFTTSLPAPARTSAKARSLALHRAARR